jgi:hypothetical protein
MFVGASGSGIAMQAASNSRNVVLLIAPTSSRSLAASWITAKSWLLYFRLFGMTDLSEFLFQHLREQLRKCLVRKARELGGEFAESSELVPRRSCSGDADLSRGTRERLGLERAGFRERG